MPKKPLLSTTAKVMFGGLQNVFYFLFIFIRSTTNEHLSGHQCNRKSRYPHTCVNSSKKFGSVKSGTLATVKVIAGSGY